VNTAHPLLEACGIPRDVVVHHEPAELQVDPLAGGVGCEEILRAATLVRLAVAFNLHLALAEIQRAVDHGDPVRESHRFEPMTQPPLRVAMLGDGVQRGAIEPDHLLCCPANEAFGARVRGNAAKAWKVERTSGSSSRHRA
jgi:hypothetical protein